tara:strand:+ start:13096 stop:13338 length:243 start_codon:yes stop_codon:yes gene_type:complete
MKMPNQHGHPRRGKFRARFKFESSVVAQVGALRAPKSQFCPIQFFPGHAKKFSEIAIEAAQPTRTSSERELSVRQEANCD